MTVSENQIDLTPPLAATSSLEPSPVFASPVAGSPVAGPDLEGGSGLLAHGVSPVLVDRPSFVFLGVVSAVTLFADIASKAWAEVAINQRGFEPIEIVDGYLSIILAYNRGGAWGLLHNASELVRRPFFLCVSAAAILFIVSLYAKLVRSQKALTWGLPLVLGGALGNLSDRISRSQVIDFLDFHADWVLKANAWVATRVPGWTVTDHWPTFNVADIAICIGVGLMAVDMMGKRGLHSPHLQAAQSQPGTLHTGQSHTGQSHTGQSHTGQSHTGQSHTGQSHTGQSLSEQDQAPLVEPFLAAAGPEFLPFQPDLEPVHDEAERAEVATRGEAKSPPAP
jgi:signal peptidase II